MAVAGKSVQLVRMERERVITNVIYFFGHGFDPVFAFAFLIYFLLFAGLDFLVVLLPLFLSPVDMLSLDTQTASLYQVTTNDRRRNYSEETRKHSLLVSLLLRFSFFLLFYLVSDLHLSKEKKRKEKRGERDVSVVSSLPLIQDPTGALGVVCPLFPL